MAASYIDQENAIEKFFDSTIHGGLRLVPGALKTTPVESLHAEADKIPPNHLRCEKLVLQYYTKLKSCSSNTAYKNTSLPQHRNLYQQKEKKLKNIWVSNGTPYQGIQNATCNSP